MLKEKSQKPTKKLSRKKLTLKEWKQVNGGDPVILDSIPIETINEWIEHRSRGSVSRSLA